MRGAPPPHPRLGEPKPVPPSPSSKGGLCQDRGINPCLRCATTPSISCCVELAGGMRVMHSPAAYIKLGFQEPSPGRGARGGGSPRRPLRRRTALFVPQNVLACANPKDGAGTLRQNELK